MNDSLVVKVSDFGMARYQITQQPRRSVGRDDGEPTEGNVRASENVPSLSLQIRVGRPVHQLLRHQVPGEVVAAGSLQLLPIQQQVRRLVVRYRPPDTTRNIWSSCGEKMWLLNCVCVQVC